MAETIRCAATGFTDSGTGEWKLHENVRQELERAAQDRRQQEE